MAIFANLNKRINLGILVKETPLLFVPVVVSGTGIKSNGKHDTKKRERLYHTVKVGGRKKSQKRKDPLKRCGKRFIVHIFDGRSNQLNKIKKRTKI